MKWPFALALLLWTVCTGIPQDVPPSGGAVEPGHGWQRIAGPAAPGFSRTGLDSAPAIAQDVETSAPLVTVDIVANVSELCGLKAIIDRGTSLLQAGPLQVIEELPQRIWRRIIGMCFSDLAGHLHRRAQPDSSPCSCRRAHTFPQERPDDDWS